MEQVVARLWHHDQTAFASPRRGSSPMPTGPREQAFHRGGGDPFANGPYSGADFNRNTVTASRQKARTADRRNRKLRRDTGNGETNSLVIGTGRSVGRWLVTIGDGTGYLWRRRVTFSAFPFYRRRVGLAAAAIRFGRGSLAHDAWPGPAQPSLSSPMWD